MVKKFGKTVDQFEYFFGFGANREGSDMIKAVTGKQPELVAEGKIVGYQLCVQPLDGIIDKGANPRGLLRKAWGDNFRSYVIIEAKDKSVSGRIYRISKYERLLLDRWELVPQGW